MTLSVFDDRACQLGEGPLWHPLLKQLFWFDITGQKLLSRNASSPQEWPFDEPVSAAGWIDAERLLIASATGLWDFNLTNGSQTLRAPLEPATATTRSNDGRTDPWGGFWIGTMGLNAEPGAGAIYRFYRGELRTLFNGVTIPNAICFAPTRRFAYFTDTAEAKVMRVALDRNGWPVGDPWVMMDLGPEGLNPDGAVVDQNGSLWIAQWGAGRVATYSDAGIFQNAVQVPAAHTTCPVFGGDDMTTLYITTATQGIENKYLNLDSDHGKTFAISRAGQGVPEPQVIL